jgi:putative SOS response-associated peptidase YedK
VRELRAFRWGLLPVFAKDIKDGARMINARAETVHQKPAYRRAFKSQRALIPVDAFYEWLETDEIGKSGKTPPPNISRALMAPPVDGSLDMYAVSKAVNSVKNNGPELLEQLSVEG